jgi:hypothetical protein
MNNLKKAILLFYFFIDSEGKFFVKALRTSPLESGSYSNSFKILKIWRNPVNEHVIAILGCLSSYMGSGIYLKQITNRWK